MKHIVLFMATTLEHAGGHENSFMGIACRLANENDVKVSVATMDEAFIKKLGMLLNVFYAKNLTSKPHARESLDHVRDKLGKAEYVKCSSFNEIKKVIKSADVVYSKNELLESFILKFIIGKKNINRLVYDCATTLEYQAPKSFHAKLHNFLYLGFAYKFLANIVDQFNAKNTYELIIYKQLFKSKKVMLVPNFFDFDEIDRTLSKGVMLFNAKNNFNVLWVGRLTQQKGLDDLIVIIETMAKMKIDGIQWHIVGEGEEREKVSLLSKKYDNVYAYGHIDNKNVLYMYRQASVFVSTSYWESFGNTLIESISQNTPVVCRAIPGPNDILIDGVNGYFAYSTDDYIKKILQFFNDDLEERDISEGVKNKFSTSNFHILTESILDY